MAGQRFLIVSAGMGAGHNQVAAELARRWRDDGDTARVVDLLEVLPPPAGRLLRGGYGSMLRWAPWLYDGVYWIFLAPHRLWQPPITPLSRLIGRTLRPIIDDFRPTAVVSTIHIAGQAVGRLRRQGALACPSVVVITEVVPHALWLAAGTDLFCMMLAELAPAAGRIPEADVITPGPVVPAHGIPPAGPVPLPEPAPTGDALITAGAWGVGAVTAAAAELAALPGIRPVVLCGRNDALRAEAAAMPGVLALGWRDDVPDLLRGAAAVIDNAGGSMCMEAIAAGVPVIEYRPIPGHGRPVARMMERCGLARYARDPAALAAAVRDLAAPGEARLRQTQRSRRIFAADPAVEIGRWLGSPRSTGPGRLRAEQG